ncbi:MAG TPA: phosphatase PAP2 family protein [Candidatus Saccharimonadales bacterium]|nr:phosphatase PAP2 family protein [Candidatus Saccharimonadales bacterium]
MHEIIILVAKYFLVLSLIGILYVAYRIPSNEKLRFVLLVIAGGIISLVLAKIANHFIHDPRPFVQGHFTPLISHAPDNGFPSDHTLLAAFLGYAALLKSRKIGIALLIVALLVGLARMAAGVHHSWDILGSFIIAGIGCVIAYYLVRLLPGKQADKSHTLKP